MSGIEGVQNEYQVIRANALAGVRDGDRHALIVIEDGDRKSPTLGHRISRIDRQIHEDLLKLGRICMYWVVTGLEFQFHADCFWQHPLKKPIKFLDEG